MTAASQLAEMVQPPPGLLEGQTRAWSLSDWVDKFQTLFDLQARGQWKSQALSEALVSEEETNLAAAEKERFEFFIGKTAEFGGQGAVASLSEAQIMKGTKGLKTPWDRFAQLDDPFFEGKAAEDILAWVEAVQQEAPGAVMGLVFGIVNVRSVASR